MECRYLAPIEKKRVKANPELISKYFCLHRITKLMNRVYLENNYNLILCADSTLPIKECPQKKSDLFGRTLKDFIKFLLKN